MRKIRDLGINVIPGTREPHGAIDGFDLATKGGKGSKGGNKKCDSATCDPNRSGANCGRKSQKITAEAIGQLQAQLLQKLESRPNLTI